MTSSPNRSDLEKALRAQRPDKRRNSADLNAPSRATSSSTRRRGQRVLGGDLKGVKSRSITNILLTRISSFGIINTVAATMVGLILVAFFWPQGTSGVKEVPQNENTVEPAPFYSESRADIPDLTEDVDESFSRETDMPRADAFREQDYIETRTNELIEQAEKYLSQDRFTSPPGKNATETYREILKLNPNDIDALQGLEYITGRFLSTGSAAVLREDWSSAEDSLAKIAIVDRESSDFTELQGLIADARLQLQLDQALTEAEQALEQGNLILPTQNNALYYFRQALELAPENSEALAGINRITDEYVALANKSALAGEFEAASGYLATVSVIDPNNASIEMVEQIISRAKPMVDRANASKASQAAVNSQTTPQTTPAPDQEPSSDASQETSQDTAANSDPTQETDAASGNESQDISSSKTPALEAQEQATFDRQYLDRGLDAYYQGDYATAAALLKPLADKGISRAQFRIAYMHYLGRGYPQNRAEADRIIRAALPAIKKFSTEGRAWAQSDLGSLYEDGLVLPRDYKEAFFWYRAAAEQGYAGAQTNLGILYARGLGVATNRNTAIEWFEKAAAQGDAAAIRNLEALGER